MKALIGIGASSGIAVGKAFLLKEDKIEISNKKIFANQIDDEIKKLLDAIEKVKTSLEALVVKTKTKVGEKEAAIFEAHLMMLQDPELYDNIVYEIKNHNYNVLKAVEIVTNNIYNQFSQIEGDYFRERASDIKDIRNKLLKYLMGIEDISLDEINEEVIVVANDLTPSQTSQLNPKYVKGFVCEVGGKTSHSAIMARSMGIPAVVGLANITKEINSGELCVLDGDKGEFLINLSSSSTEIKKWRDLEKEWKNKKSNLLKYMGLKTQTLDKFIFHLEANIGSIKNLKNVIENDGEGIGLFRTEFLYMERETLPTEEDQFEAYKNALVVMKGKKVIIRTLDIGGDKDLSYLQISKENNPFLGYRAIRLCLDRQDIFKTQLRALLRASVYGELWIMFPMIATIEEFKKAKKILESCKLELLKENKQFSNNIKVGIMIEIPAAAVNADLFAKYADFFSIGTNDLIQYSLATDRMSEKVSYLYQPYHPAILRLIKNTIDGANKYKIPVGMCGEMASDKIAIPILVGLGLNEFSMSASEILPVRKLINNLNKLEMEKLAHQALNCETNEEVKRLVLDVLNYKKLLN